MSDLISRSELILRLSDYALQESPNDNESTGEQRISKMIYDAIQNCISCVEEQPTAYDIDKVVTELNELDVKSITRYKNGNFGNFDGVEYYIKKRKAIEIVKQEAEQYKECYNDCGDCEAYNKEKYHCPKFCKAIKETVKEIEDFSNKLDVQGNAKEAWNRRADNGKAD